MLEFKYYKIEVELLTEILGTVSKNEDTYKYHAQDKARKEALKYGQELTEEQVQAEMATIQEQFIKEKGWSGFHWYEGTPVLWDYVIKGYMKEAIEGCRRFSGSECSKLTAYKKLVAQAVFVYPMLIDLSTPDMPASPQEMATLSRSLRAQTAQGERVTLAKSDALRPGTKFEFELWIGSNKLNKPVLEEIFLEYGKLKGFGQWRSGGKGRFKATLTELDAPQHDPLDLPDVFDMITNQPDSNG
jgi:hypothetical protein